MYHNSATHPEGLHMIVREDRREEVTGVVVGSKTTDEVGCLSTLMNSLNEVISVTLRQFEQTRQLTKNPCTRKFTPRESQATHLAPLNLLNDNKIDLMTRKAKGPESYARVGECSPSQNP